MTRHDQDMPSRTRRIRQMSASIAEELPQLRRVICADGSRRRSADHPNSRGPTTTASNEERPPRIFKDRETNSCPGDDFLGGMRWGSGSSTPACTRRHRRRTGPGPDSGRLTGTFADGAMRVANRPLAGAARFGVSVTGADARRGRCGRPARPRRTGPRGGPPPIPTNPSTDRATSLLANVPGRSRSIVHTSPTCTGTPIVRCGSPRVR